VSEASEHSVSERLCLAIEASNPGVHAEVALGHIRGPRDVPTLLALERLREVGRNEDGLLPAIQRACAAAGAKPRDIRTVAVSIGPGGYTSLRVACAAGKMIAAATGAACVGIPTALVVARSASAHSKDARLGVLLAGKDETAYLTPFQRGGWQFGDALPRGGLVSASDFPVDELDIVIGDPHVPSSISELLAARSVQVIEPRFSASACLELASQLSEVDAIQLVPLYPREPDAVTLWRKRRAI
jgi:tRNA threonylcarbamoyl adenosine modification protein YeaZ